MKLFLLGLLCSLSCASAYALQAPQNLQQKQEEIRALRAELQRISARLDALEASETSAGTASTTGTPASTSADTRSTASTVQKQNEASLAFLRGTTLNFNIDGYYAYNFNEPAGRVNLLRSYDVSSNSFSLNQVNFIAERLAASAPGQRVGGRIDLQFGQATEAAQGSSANELRPQVWRNLFQAYGSYLAPVGTGLQIDFGKWSSALGVEGNYTKDQINYSRSLLFAFLPLYHMGIRANYNVTPQVNVGYWLVNGTQQTEDFNGFKSQAFVATLRPAKSLTWNLNYYFGQERRDMRRSSSPGTPAPNGREHIFDSYATWNATSRLTLVGEADYAVDRVELRSTPAHVTGGAAYLRYALDAHWAVAARGEYLSDRGGLLSGTTQTLKETTFTLERMLDPGLLMRLEYRRDLSDRRYFPTSQTGVLDKSQTTATAGLVYWWGMKQGNW